MRLQVSFERSRMRESHIANGTRERLLTGMSTHVCAQISRKCKLFLANAAVKRLLFLVNRQHVSSQTRHGAELLGTSRTVVRSRVAVNSQVHGQHGLFSEAPRALGALVGPQIGVHRRMEAQGDLVLESPTAVSANVRRLVRVSPLVERPAAVLREPLAAALDATNQRFLTGVREHVRLQSHRRCEHSPALAAHMRLRRPPRRRRHAAAGWRGVYCRICDVSGARGGS